LTEAAADIAVNERIMQIRERQQSEMLYNFENTLGMAATEEIIRTVSAALTHANPDAVQIARISEDQFAVLYASEEALDAQMQQSAEAFSREISGYNAKKIRSWLPEDNSGSTKLASGWRGILLENLIHLALGELYLNRLRASASGLIRKEQNISGLYSAFAQLMEQNLFQFYFQPIVAAGVPERASA
jgi:GGDEF domain-containing protein